MTDPFILRLKPSIVREKFNSTFYFKRGTASGLGRDKVTFFESREAADLYRAERFGQFANEWEAVPLSEANDEMDSNEKMWAELESSKVVP